MRMLSLYSFDLFMLCLSFVLRSRSLNLWCIKILKGLAHSSSIEGFMEVSVVLAFRDKEENKDQVGTSHNADQPVEPTPTFILDQETRDDRGQRTAKAEPNCLNTSLSAAFVQKEEVK